MIRCKLCGLELVVKGGDRAYAIEEGRIGGYVCRLDMGTVIYHKPEVIYHETNR
jgi:hypothetical protein